MRPTATPPLNRRYFHTQPSIDKKDIAVLKKKIEAINQKKHNKELEDKEKKKTWHI